MPPTFAVDSTLPGVASVSAGGLAPVTGTIWLHFPDHMAFPVLYSLEAQGKSSSPNMKAQPMAPTVPGR